MKTQDILNEFENLAERIAATPEGKQYKYCQELDKLIERMEEAGVDVPQAARRLDERLCEDAIEAQFDNMPL